MEGELFFSGVLRYFIICFLVIAAILNIDNLLGRCDTEDVGHRLANNDIVLDADTNALVLFGISRVSWNVQTGFCG